MSKRDDKGFTFIEMLVVIVMLGVLSTVVAVAVRGMSTNAEESACASDANILVMSTEAYFAQKQREQRSLPPTPPATATNGRSSTRSFCTRHLATTTSMPPGS